MDTDRRVKGSTFGAATILSPKGEVETGDARADAAASILRRLISEVGKMIMKGCTCVNKPQNLQKNRRNLKVRKSS